MKKVLFVFYTFLCCVTLSVAQTKPQAFKAGEYLKFRVSYGILNAGIAEMQLSEVTYKGQTMYHAKGIGYTTGLSKVFFKVYDDYQSYFEKGQVVPHRFIRKIDEGGYTKDQEGFFNYAKNNVLVKDYEKNKETTYPIVANVQDIVSAFYYLRNNPKLDHLKKNEAVEIDMFFDGEVFRFKLLYLGTTELKTKFGKIKALTFRPYVMAGRVFKEKESLTVWVSADANKVPLRIKASLAVGSLKADLEEYQGLVSTLKQE
ncbi:MULTISPECIES: DUF3108 domain-containing protein [unclassified Myroides]|uniref:DUF3108 domain-containing protein n=1 Tax=unclassified Myroides TaxID=2642485 RepID=UPI003D2F9592